MAIEQEPPDGPGLSWGQTIVGTLGLSLLRLQPRVSKDLAVSLAPAEAPIAGMTAIEGLPILLALVLDRPADVHA